MDLASPSRSVRGRGKRSETQGMPMPRHTREHLRHSGGSRRFSGRNVHPEGWTGAWVSPVHGGNVQRTKGAQLPHPLKSNKTESHQSSVHTNARRPNKQTHHHHRRRNRHRKINRHHGSTMQRRSHRNLRRRRCRSARNRSHHKQPLAANRSKILARRCRRSRKRRRKRFRRCPMDEQS